jgi:hypothetical protein
MLADVAEKLPSISSAFALALNKKPDNVAKTIPLFM